MSTKYPRRDPKCLANLGQTLLIANYFRSYGWDVFMYSQMTLEEQRKNVNPFCRAFPTDVSCTVPNVGAAGGEQNHNGLCILSQNIINEKVND